MPSERQQNHGPAPAERRYGVVVDPGAPEARRRCRENAGERPEFTDQKVGYGCGLVPVRTRAIEKVLDGA